MGGVTEGKRERGSEETRDGKKMEVEDEPESHALKEPQVAVSILEGT